MSHVEALEFAAKAAGVPVHNAMRADWRNNQSNYWNPWVDERVAFRLAITLRLKIEHNYTSENTLWVAVYGEDQDCYIVQSFDSEEHRIMFTQRTIVSVAAAIGQAKGES